MEKGAWEEQIRFLGDPINPRFSSTLNPLCTISENLGRISQRGLSLQLNYRQQKKHEAPFLCSLLPKPCKFIIRLIRREFRRKDRKIPNLKSLQENSKLEKSVWKEAPCSSYFEESCFRF